jgi:hypothetical protein
MMTSPQVQELLGRVTMEKTEAVEAAKDDARRGFLKMMGKGAHEFDRSGG